MISRLDAVHSTIRSNKPLAIAVQMLCRARHYAQRVQCNPWHFAIELEEFHTAGIGRVDLRLLLSANLVEHAQEIVDLDAPIRKFKRLPSHVVPADSCFILSEYGFAKLAQLAVRTVATPVENAIKPKPRVSNQLDVPAEATPNHQIPQWDGCQKRLSFKGALVKQFVYSAPNQEAILTAFQEESWPHRVDDPLVPTSDQDARQRLKDTIRYLNQRMENPLLVFRGDGTGTGIVWQIRG